MRYIRSYKGYKKVSEGKAMNIFAGIMTTLGSLLSNDAKAGLHHMKGFPTFPDSSVLYHNHNPDLSKKLNDDIDQLLSQLWGSTSDGKDINMHDPEAQKIWMKIKSAKNKDFKFSEEEFMDLKLEFSNYTETHHLSDLKTLGDSINYNTDITELNNVYSQLNTIMIDYESPKPNVDTNKPFDPFAGTLGMILLLVIIIGGISLMEGKSIFRK